MANRLLIANRLINRSMAWILSYRTVRLSMRRKRNMQKNVINYRHQTSNPPHAPSFFTNEKRPCESEWLKKKITQEIEKVHGPRSTNPAAARSARTHTDSMQTRNAPETETRILARRTSSRFGIRDKLLH